MLNSPAPPAPTHPLNTPPPFKGAGEKEAMSYFVPAVHASFFVPFRCGLPLHHFTYSIFSKVFVFPLQTLRYISLINRQKPRHSQQAFRLHFIVPQPLLLNRYSFFFPCGILTPNTPSKPHHPLTVQCIAYFSAICLRHMSLSPFHYVPGLQVRSYLTARAPSTTFHCKSAISLSNPRKRSPFTAFRNLTPELQSTSAKANGIIIHRGICFRCGSIPPGYCFIPFVATLAFPSPVQRYALRHYYPKSIKPFPVLFNQKIFKE